MDYDLNVTQLTTGLGGLLTDEMTSFTEDMVGADSPLHTTPPSFGFKPNMTVRKFFNVSIPIEDKFDLGEFDLGRHNLTNKINELDIIPPIHPSTNFLLFLCSLLFAMFWVTYITFLNSRLVGSISTNIANRFLVRWWPRTYFRVGSLSFSVLAGKIMFRDILFLTPDWSFRSQDGYIIFRWWRSYVPEVRVWREFDTLANFNYTWTGCF